MSWRRSGGVSSIFFVVLVMFWQWFDNVFVICVDSLLMFCSRIDYALVMFEMCWLCAGDVLVVCWRCISNIVCIPCVLALEAATRPWPFEAPFLASQGCG